MLWALMAKFLTRQPPLVQAGVVGLCAGLFMTTGAQANNRNPLIQTVLLQVIVVGLIAGALFFVGLVKGPQDAHDDDPRWAYVVYAVVWLGALLAALLALFGNGGFKVAALAIVPLVLLAPPAFQAFRRLTQRSRR